LFQQRDTEPKRSVEVHTFPSTDNVFHGTVVSIVGNRKVTPVSLEERIHDNYPAARVVVQDQLGRPIDPSGTLPIVWYVFRDNSPRPREGRIEPRLPASAAGARPSHGAGAQGRSQVTQGQSQVTQGHSQVTVNGRKTRRAGWTPIAPVACQFCGAAWPAEGLGVVGRPRDAMRARSIPR